MISVCMTTYNGERYIEKQIETILDNLKEEDELIISDDGSLDGTLTIIKDYMEKDKRIHLINGPRQGIIANFENAIKEAKGEFIYLSDQDDIWMKEKVATVQKAFEMKDCSVVVHDAKVMNQREEVFMDSFFAYRNAKAGMWHNVIKNSYIGCCMAFKRELLTQILPIPRNIAMHDQWIGIWGDLEKGSFFIPDKLIAYRRHDENSSSLTHSKVTNMVKMRCIFLKELNKRKQWLKKH